MNLEQIFKETGENRINDLKKLVEYERKKQAEFEKQGNEKEAMKALMQISEWEKQIIDTIKEINSSFAEENKELSKKAPDMNEMKGVAANIIEDNQKSFFEKHGGKMKIASALIAATLAGWFGSNLMHKNDSSVSSVEQKTCVHTNNSKLVKSIQAQIKKVKPQKVRKKNNVNVIDKGVKKITNTIKKTIIVKKGNTLTSLGVKNINEWRKNGYDVDNINVGQKLTIQDGKLINGLKKRNVGLDKSKTYTPKKVKSYKEIKKEKLDYHKRNKKRQSSFSKNKLSKAGSIYNQRYSKHYEIQNNNFGELLNSNVRWNGHFGKTYFKLLKSGKYYGEAKITFVGNDGRLMSFVIHNKAESVLNKALAEQHEGGDEFGGMTWAEGRKLCLFTPNVVKKLKTRVGVSNLDLYFKIEEGAIIFRDQFMSWVVTNIVIGWIDAYSGSSHKTIKKQPPKTTTKCPTTTHAVSTTNNVSHVHDSVTKATKAAEVAKTADSVTKATKAAEVVNDSKTTTQAALDVIELN